MMDGALRLGGVDFVPAHTALDELQALLAIEPATWQMLDGAPLRANEAVLMMDDRPTSVPAENKRAWVAPGVCAIDMLVGFPTETTWYLGLILIAPTMRGTGVGTAILRDLFAMARANGATAFRLAVVVENTAARRLYDRLGFVHVARRSRTAYDGHVHDVDVLELAL